MSGPRVATIALSDIAGGNRLDAAYYQDEFILAQLRVRQSGLDSVPLAGEGGLVNAWIPGRTSLVFATSSENGTPYLRAHDALERLPPFERYIALNQMKDGEQLRLRKGWIVLTCSGRNFGPCAWVDAALARAAMTDIMRLEPGSEADGLYVLAFLNSPTGRTLIRRDQAGSVINHLTPKDLAGLRVPLLPSTLRKPIVRKIRRAVQLFELAGLELTAVDADLREELKLDVGAAVTWPLSEGAPRTATIEADQLLSRLDPEYYSERHKGAREAVAAASHARLDQLSELRILGRYKRFYVEPPHGTPILSGSQLHQIQPVALRNISDRSFKRPDDYSLQRGWSLVACDGRSEGDLGRPGYVSSLWDGWMASNHLMRVIAREGIDPGYLHAALRLREVQVQFKSVATGSVVDGLDEVTCGGILLPRVGKIEKSLGQRVAVAYEKWAEGYELLGEGANEFEHGVQSAYERQSGSILVS